MSLADSLEQAASELPVLADSIRPANGDPSQLLASLDTAAASQVLAWLLAHRVESGEELALGWLEHGEGGVSAVSSLDETALPKAGRKALRRVRHRARSAGLDLAPPAAPEAKVSRLPKVEEEMRGAYLSPHDPRGGRLVYLIEPNPSGGARVFEALLDEQRGVVDFQVYAAGRSQVRDFIRDVTRRKRFAAIPAEPEAVRGLIRRALARHPADRPLPKALSQWRTRLLEVEGEARTPGELVREALSDEYAGPGIEAVVEMITSRALGPWPPPQDDLNAVVESFRAQLEPVPGALSEESRAALQEACQKLYSGKLAQITAERLEESAYMMWKRGAEDQARACLAAATSLRQGDVANHPISVAIARVVSEALATDLEGRSRAAEEPAGQGA